MYPTSYGARKQYRFKAKYRYTRRMPLGLPIKPYDEQTAKRRRVSYVTAPLGMDVDTLQKRSRKGMYSVNDGPATQNYVSKAVVKGASTLYGGKPIFLRRPPVIRGTSHKTEARYVMRSSVITGNNPIKMELQRLGVNKIIDGGGAGLESQTVRTDLDNYNNTVSGTDTWPSGVRKVFFKGIGLRIQMVNNLETNCQIRIAIARAKKGFNSTQAEFGTDPTRTANSRHFNVLHADYFLMNPQNIGESGGWASIIVKKYWIPVGRWVETETGDPGTTTAMWQNDNDESQRIYLFLHSDDATDTDLQYVQFTIDVKQYWYTAETIAT